MFKPKDVVAVLLIVGIFFDKYLQVNAFPSEVLTLIIGYYFVKRRNGMDNGK